MKKQLLALLIGTPGFLLSGCVVYMPTQCAAPQITAAHQGEVSASTYLNGRYELAGTYSPAPHVLLRASYGNLPQGDGHTDTTFYRGHHYDLGIGTYGRLGDKWLVGGLGGFGQARNEAAYSVGGFLFGRPVQHTFDARYRKLFGEVYGSYQASNAFSMGAAYRVTQVNFTTLTDRGIPVDLSSMTRSEPMLFVRVRLGDGPTEERPVQLQLAWGLSGTFGYDANDGYTDYAPGVREMKQSRGYTTIGISIFPHCLFRKAQPEGQR